MRSSKQRLSILLAPFACLLVIGCNSSGTSKSADEKPVIGVAFETLQTEYWVAGFDAIKSECEKHGYAVIESVADQDANRQLQQVKNMIK